MRGPIIPVKVGDIVLFNGHMSNGIIEHPAVVTRVWTETMVNVRVTPDMGEPYNQGSVNYSDTPNEQVSWREKQPF